MGDLYLDKRISPMLIAENVKPFEDSGCIYEMKWDGERCIAYLDPVDGTVLRNKRQVTMNPKVPELANIHTQAKKRCILDGELICMADGTPSFEAIQRRSLMSNQYRIELEAQRFPATFIAFDCLYFDGQDLTMLPLMERKKYLKKAVKETDRLAISRVYPSTKAWELWQIACQQGLEGIVAKEKDSLYFQGKRTKAWKKIKNLMDDDFAVCGYIYKENHMISLILGQFSGNEIIYRGHVTLGVGGEPFERIKAEPRALRPPFARPVPEGHGNEDAIWLYPRLACTIQFMHHTKNGGMRQPVFKGLRHDKRPEDCLYNPQAWQ